MNRQCLGNGSSSRPDERANPRCGTHASSGPFGRLHRVERVLDTPRPSAVPPARSQMATTSKRQGTSWRCLRARKSSAMAVDPGLLVQGDGLRRLAVPLAGPRLHLDEHDGRAVAGDDVNFAKAGAVAPGKNCVARGARVRGTRSLRPIFRAKCDRGWAYGRPFCKGGAGPRVGRRACPPKPRRVGRRACPPKPRRVGRRACPPKPRGRRRLPRHLREQGAGAMAVGARSGPSAPRRRRRSARRGSAAGTTRASARRTGRARCPAGGSR